MDSKLYRQEALDHQHRRLFGDVILTSPPKTYIITALLLLTACVILGALLGLSVTVESADVRLWQWILGYR